MSDKTKVKILVERYQNSFTATSRDEFGVIASASSHDKETAVQKAKGRTEDVIEGEIIYEIQEMNPKGPDSE